MLSDKRTEQEIVNGWVDKRCLVSIICNTYNHESFISDAIDGFLCQATSFKFEILIHDDSSTDNTQSILRDYEIQYPNIIKVIYQKENQFSKGVRITNEIQIPRAIGKYVAMCEGDDYWINPKKLEKQVTFLEANPSFVGCFTDYMVVNSKGNIINQSKSKSNNIKSEYTHTDILSRLTPKTLTVLYRMKCVPKKLPTNLRECLNGDLINASLLSLRGSYKYLNFVSGAYREHNNGIWSLTGDKSRYHNQVKTSLRMMDYFNSMEQIDALRHRLKNACTKLKDIYKKEGNSKMIVWCKWVLLKSIFKYSFKDLIHKLISWV